MLAALVAFASAQTVCQDLEPDRFRSLIVDSQSALDRGDLDLLKAVLAEIEADIPCLRFAPPPRLWADLMAVQAVANFAEDEDWKSPLAAALRIRPGIDRGVGRSHPMYNWTPEEPVLGRPYEGKSTLYVDGQVASLRPPSAGWYLIQKTDGEYWETYWQRDSPVSTTWLNEEVERPDELFWQASGGLQVGFGHITQSMIWRVPNSDPERWVTDDSRFYTFGDPSDGGATPGWGGVFKGRFSYGGLGLAAGGSVLFGLQPGLRDIRFSAIYNKPVYTVGAGVSWNDVFLRTRSAENPSELASTETYFDRFFHGELTLRTGRRFIGEVFLLAGVHDIQTYSGLLDITLTFEKANFLGGRPQIGGQAGFAMGRFIREDEESMRLLSVGTRVTTHFTLLFGSWSR